MCSNKRALLSQAYLNDAFSLSNIDFDEDMIRLYLMFRTSYFSFIPKCSALLLLALVFVENPCTKPFCIPFWGSVVLEMLCLILLTLRLLHELFITKRASFWSDWKHICQGLLIILTLIDIAQYTILLDETRKGLTLRWSRPWRPFFFLNLPENRLLRQGCRNIRKIIPNLVHVLVLFVSSLALFALLAFKLFGTKSLTLNHDNSKAYFSTFFESMWELLVLVTTANHPDIVLPAYSHSLDSIPFFVSASSKVLLVELWHRFHIPDQESFEEQGLQSRYLHSLGSLHSRPTHFPGRVGFVQEIGSPHPVGFPSAGPSTSDLHFQHVQFRVGI
ncbi:two pore calcium channel protein 1-like [Tigriopus californicus]|uniref:two pore calcium channel protein 1-like n=1 Tax=Tigriopus californicus TaxID=6832 RepID=UPI0027DA5F9A|nr:two pore calcium channel protein 1-like [Tigriopus californicus]